MKVLVTGGAGYIGSHTCVELLEAGHEVFVIDNLCNGHEAALKRVRGITNCELRFMNADISDTSALDKIFNNFKPEAVIHFAGLKAVGESVANPLMYYDVNVGGTISLLNAMTKSCCNNIVFSSSATVYGDPQYLPYDEYHPTNPVSPYGRTKLIIEKMIHDWVSVKKARNGTILRYFNPVGAHQSGLLGEQPKGTPNNLMPFVMQTAVGKQKKLMIFGNDYETKDGSCLRDFIHIVDLANAHLRAINSISKPQSFEVFNIGRGKGVSVLELIKSFEIVSGILIDCEYAPRRNGDLPAFWADASKASKVLGWEPKFTLADMCLDAWRWQSNSLKGCNIQIS